MCAILYTAIVYKVYRSNSFLLFCSCLEEHDKDGAVKYFCKVLELDPDSEPAKEGLAELWDYIETQKVGLFVNLFHTVTVTH